MKKIALEALYVYLYLCIVTGALIWQATDSLHTTLGDVIASTIIWYPPILLIVWFWHHNPAPRGKDENGQ